MSKKTTKSGGLTSIQGGRGRDGGDGPEAPRGPGKGNVVDFGTIRAQRNLDNRRSVERFFLQRMIDVFCEVGDKDLLPIEVVEVSETGCSFRLSAEKSKNLPRDGQGNLLPINARFYFSSDSYLRIGLNLLNSTTDIADGGTSMRFGCQVEQSFASSDAFSQFVRFIEVFAKHCSRDGRQASAF